MCLAICVFRSKGKRAISVKKQRARMAIQNADKGLEYFDAGSEELLKIREAEIKRGKGKKKLQGGIQKRNKIFKSALVLFYKQNVDQYITFTF